MFRRLMQLAGLALAPFAVLLASRVFGMLAAAPIALVYFLRQQRLQKLSYRAQQMFTSLLGQQDRKVFRRMTSLGRRVREHFAAKWGLVTLPLCVVLFQLLSALLLTPIGLKMAWDAERWSGFLSDLWQVHASVIGITFVVIVLLVETVGTRLGREHLFRLYVRETNIQPMAYAGLTLTATIGLVRLVIAHFDPKPWWAGVVMCQHFVVMDGRLRYHEQLFNSEDFLPAWSQECEPLNWPGFEQRMEGRIHGVPVFAVDGMPSDNVLVLDLKRLGRWMQYQMESAPGETFWFCLNEIDHEKAAEWVNQSPHLMDTEKGETRDQAIWRLQQQVHLRVLERFEYLVEDSSAGIRIEVIGEE